jgi:adenine-specific DNA-methyltransferase
MAEEATVGFMIWDGKSIGTLMNVLRLARHGKKVVVYIAPLREFVDVRSESDVERIVARCAPELRKRLEHEEKTDQEVDEASKQAHLL